MTEQSEKPADFTVDTCPAGAEYELCLLFELSAAMEEEPDPAKLPELILRRLAIMLGADRAALVSYNGDGTPSPAGRIGSIDNRLEQSLLEQSQALTRAQGLRLLTPSDDLFRDLHLDQYSAAWAVFRFRRREAVMGAFLVGRSDGQPFAQLSERLLTYVESVFARAMEHSRLAGRIAESEARYRRIFEHSKDTHYVTSKEGKFVDVNQAAVEMFGFDSREELLGIDSIAQLYYRPKDRGAFMEVIERQGYVKDYETTFRNKNGDPIEVSITSNVQRNKAGEVVGYEGIMRDITSHKRLLKMLSESEAKYRAVVENSADGIGIYANRGFLYVNKAFLQMFDYQRLEELRKTDILKVVSPDSRGNFLAFLVRYSKNPSQAQMFEGEAIRKDGSVFSVEMRGFPTTFEEMEAHQIVFQDVTEKKQMEEQLIQSERLAATGNLAFDIAHEINNPLGGIITYTHLLLEDLPPRGLERDNAEKILKLANRCKIIVKGLLDFARAESAELESVDINALLHEALMLIGGHVILRNVRIKLELCKNIPLLRAVRVKLEQVFLNIIVNAAEAMDGKGSLTITTEHAPEDKLIRIHFTDTGHGVEPEHEKKLFEPFFTTKQRGRGTGLGLSISHGIIKQHNGTISVQSSPGQGSTFTIELPL